jgi:phage terminase large subunit
MTNPLNIEIAESCLAILKQESRYKVLYGGRGASRSWSVARYLLGKAAGRKLRILCTREVQNTIKDSVFRLLVDQIVLLQVQDYFKVKAETLSSFAGAEFLFKGLRQNIEEIKSTEGIDIVWVEEGEKVSKNSWDTLIPTIRKDNSEIIVTFNPDEEKADTYQRFVVHPPPDCAAKLVNWHDNPWFPEVLRKEMEYCKRIDYEKYRHIWEGECTNYSEACIFKRVKVEAFETPAGPDPTVPAIQFYFGADFGFSVDPTILVRCFLKDNRLYIDHEAYGHGVEIDDLHQFFATVPGSDKWRIIADSERPDTINFLAQPHKGKNGTMYPAYNIVGAEKGKGSVEDGIQFLSSFEEIIIHPRCPGSADNFKNYRWKRDKITDDILPIPAEGSDHATDASRYALEPYIKKSVTIFDVFANR